MQEVYRRLRTIVSVRHDIVYLVHIMQVLYQTYIDFVHDGGLLNEFAVIYLFIIIPQGYLPCTKLFMVLDESFILISSDCVSFF